MLCCCATWAIFGSMTLVVIIIIVIVIESFNAVLSLVILRQGKGESGDGWRSAYRQEKSLCHGGNNHE